MYSVLAAKPAILVQLKLIGRILLVLRCVVIPLLAFIASKRNLYSHLGASLRVGDMAPDCLPVDPDS